MIKPMLASDYDEAKLKFPLIIQPKIDGVRGCNLEGTLVARTLKPFANMRMSSLFANTDGLDGELTLGSDLTSSSLCRDTTSVLNTKDDIRALDLQFNVFDYYTEITKDMPYEERLMVATKYVGELHLTDKRYLKIRMVDFKIAHNLEELYAAEKEWLAQGYEGTIIRDPKGKYKQGRSTAREGGLLRIKRFVQEDAIVLSITEAMENTNEAVKDATGKSKRSSHKENLVPKGMLGNLVCRDVKTGKEITVGPGEMTHQERVHYWINKDSIIGSIISYKSFPKGVKDKPRFPVYVGIRIKEDVVND